MKKTIYSFLILTFLISSTPAFASEEFNPNFLISDEEMQDYKSMHTEDIQAFLEDKGGYLSELRTSNKDGHITWASKIIYDAAKEHKINPKYLLVKLQKEQSLVTDTDPTQKQLDGATGYGIRDGCGWDCDTYKRNKGFGKQVDAAAGIMRWYYDNAEREAWIKKPGVTYSISNTSVKPANLATAFLYTYTPHIQGNQNFWILWQRWFDQVYPSGSLVKATNDNTVYLIQNNQKRPFGSFAALMTRFDPKFILEVPASELLQYEIGPAIALPNYSILRQGNNYYLLDYDVLRKFESKQTIQQLGYHPDEIIEVTTEDIRNFSIAPKDITATNKSIEGYLLHATDINAYYFIKDGTYAPVIDKQIAFVNFPTVPVREGTLADVKGLDKKDNLLFRDGTLLGITGYNEIYVIENGRKRHIVNEEVFLGLGYKWENVTWTHEVMGMLHRTGQPVYLQREITTPKTIVADAAPPQTKTTENTLPGHKDLIRTSKEDTILIGKELATDVETYLIADYDTEKILAGKNIDVVRPMASFTKMVTAYGLMKEGLDLNGTVTYDTAKHKSNYHRFRTADGEVFRNSDVLDAMLVSSLNTPARMLVSEVAHSDAAFIQTYNAQLKNWGLTASKLTDVYGYDLGNVTTAREYMTILKKTGSNKTVKDFVSKQTYKYSELTDIDGKPDHYDYHTNDLVNTDGLPFSIIISKTGYLHEAGPCLAMVIERPSDKKKFIVITMGGHDYANRFKAPEKLSSYAVQQF